MNGTRGLVLAVIAAFVVGCSAGLVGGALLVHFVYPHRPWLFGGAPPFGRPEGGRPMMDMLSRKLELTPDQRQSIDRILEQARVEHTARRESTRAEIRRILTPEQRTRWEDLEQRLRHRRDASWPQAPRGPDRP